MVRKLTLCLIALFFLAANRPASPEGQAKNNNKLSAEPEVLDISGYYTTNTSGQVYHSVNPTRLVDTRSGIGGSTGALGVTATYSLGSADTQQITTVTTPTAQLRGSKRGA